MAAKKKTSKKKTTAKKAQGKKKAPAKKAPAKKKASAKKPARAKPAAKPKPKKAASPRPAAKAVAPVNPLRALAQRIIDVSASNDETAILALYDPNVESIEIGMPPMIGIGALRQKFEGWRNMVSDSTFVPVNVWADGNHVIVEWQGDCTLAGSGRQVKLNEIAVHEIKNGKIVRERYYYDPATLAP